jgi:hypothetical protein
VRQFRSFAEEENAEFDYYRTLSGNEKLPMLLELIVPENLHEVIIERSA